MPEGVCAGQKLTTGKQRKGNLSRIIRSKLCANSFNRVSQYEAFFGFSKYVELLKNAARIWSIFVRGRQD